MCPVTLNDCFLNRQSLKILIFFGEITYRVAAFIEQGTFFQTIKCFLKEQIVRTVEKSYVTFSIKLS